MLVDFEAERRQLRDPTWTTVHVESFPTLTAEEMVMMTAIGRPITHVADPKLHGPNLTGVLQALEVPVNSRNAERRHFAGSLSQDVRSL